MQKTAQLIGKQSAQNIYINHIDLSTDSACKPSKINFTVFTRYFHTYICWDIGICFQFCISDVIRMFAECSSLKSFCKNPAIYVLGCCLNNSSTFGICNYHCTLHRKFGIFFILSTVVLSFWAHKKVNTDGSVQKYLLLKRRIPNSEK